MLQSELKLARLKFENTMHGCCCGGTVLVIEYADENDQWLLFSLYRTSTLLAARNPQAIIFEAYVPVGG